MWLLHIKKFQLHNKEPDTEPYIILSHRWEEEELTYQDLADRDKASLKKGYTKVRSFCNLIRRLFPDIEYAWIDTCCIDKTNSAELSEAINSMFRWYEKAFTCFAYLSDVEHFADLTKSQWFERGWTLQELLAPCEVVFYNTHWETVGKRSSLGAEIGQITKIPIDALYKRRGLNEFSVATRMSWAAHRRTTRQEDLAYCLLGLFDIFMPLIYGEGARAFQRLQEEIMRSSRDLSILAWEFQGDEPELSESSIFANHPRCFRTYKYQKFEFETDRYPHFGSNLPERNPANRLCRTTVSSVTPNQIILDGWLVQYHHRRYLLATCFSDRPGFIVCVVLGRLPYGDCYFTAAPFRESRTMEIPTSDIDSSLYCHIILMPLNPGCRWFQQFIRQVEETPFYFRVVVKPNIDHERVTFHSRSAVAPISGEKHPFLVLSDEQTGMAGIVRIDPSPKSAGRILVLGHTFEATEFCLSITCGDDFTSSTPLEEVVAGGSHIAFDDEVMELVEATKRRMLQGTIETLNEVEFYEIPNGSSWTSFILKNGLSISMENDAEISWCTVYVEEGILWSSDASATR